MNTVKNLFEYKTKALNTIILDDDIVKALCDNTPQFIDNNDSSILTNRDSLFYNNLYPYMFIPDESTSAKSYITISLKGFDSDSYTTTEGWVIIRVISHIGLISTESGQRHGFIANAIDNKMYATSGFGIGKISRRQFDEFEFANEKSFVGVSLAYHITDFSL